MNDVLISFYNKILPGLLQGNIDCEYPVRIICNVYFEETCKFLRATDEYPSVIIPTLTINNKTQFEMLLIQYVETMLHFYEDVNFASIEKENYIPYIIATSFANMGKDDYDKPEQYFIQRINAINDFPLQLCSRKETASYNPDFNAIMSYSIEKEKPNEEAPFKYTLYLSDGEDTYEFQTIRFFIDQDTAYIGAIQGNKPSSRTQFQKKMNIKTYKANQGIDDSNPLYHTSSGSVIALTSFIALLNSYGISKIRLAPYGIQRWNDKQILCHNLPKQLTIPNQSEQTKFKIVEKIERTSSYFDKLPHIRTQLKNALLRFAYHMHGCTVTEENDCIYIECHEITNGNNILLNNTYGTFNYPNNKKTNRQD